VKKTYIALVHASVKADRGTIHSSISRDSVRRIRMTTAAPAAARRSRITRCVADRIRLRKFTLLEVKIDTGRTHQIRVHLSSLGHPVVGDALYGARATELRRIACSGKRGRTDRSGAQLPARRGTGVAPSAHGGTARFAAELPEELQVFVKKVEQA